MTPLLLSLLLAGADARTPQWLHGVAPPHAPQRIVSLAPVITETLFAVGAGDRVVGDTRFCDKPAAATALPHVGGYVDVSVEAVLALHPDAVMAMPSMGQRDALERLAAAHIPVLVVFGDTVPEVHALIAAVGDATGHSNEAQRIIQRLREARTRYTTQPQDKRRVAVVVGINPIVVAGPGTFADDALGWVGFTSALSKGAPAWPQWSLEALAAVHPDVLVVTEGQAQAQALRQQLAALPHPPAVLASSRPILQRPGPSLDEDIATLSALLRASATGAH